MKRPEYVEPIVHTFVEKETENVSSTLKTTIFELPFRIQPYKDVAYLVNRHHAHFDTDRLWGRPT